MITSLKVDLRPSEPKADLSSLVIENRVRHTRGGSSQLLNRSRQENKDGGSSHSYFKAWFIYSIGTVLIAFFAGMAVGFVLGAVMGATGVPLDTIRTVCGIAGAVFGIIVSFIMFRWSVDRFIVPAITTPENV